MSDGTAGRAPGASGAAGGVPDLPGSVRRCGRLAAGFLVVAVGLMGCGEESRLVRGLSCDLAPDLLVSNRAPDAIPALTEPSMVPTGSIDAEYLDDEDRVLGVFRGGEARAYPHNILWYHEVVNDRIGGELLSITFCPLTGSGVGFVSEIDGREVDLGVSGLLYANNLVLYDRASGDVYGPQLIVTGACDPFRGAVPTLVPVQEMSWAQWKELHPETLVVSQRQRFGRNYSVYPYGTYDEITSNELLVSMSVDRSRPIKERVLAVRDGTGGRGYPYGELRELGEVAALNEIVGGTPTVVFYDSRRGEVALAFEAAFDGQMLSFDASPDGSWIDRETGSTWALGGRAVSGPLEGARLRTRADAYTLFWFAWRYFQPDGRTYTAG